MKMLYLECHMGAAGDMLMAALYELLEDKSSFLHTMEHLLPSVSVVPEIVSTCGITGTHMNVAVHDVEEHSHDVALGTAEATHHEHEHVYIQDHTYTHGHHHHSPMDIRHILEHLDIPEDVRCAAQAVYDRIAQAESLVHGVPVEQVHFHEVGALDAVADIVGVCLAIHILQPDRVITSPIHLGNGQVRCAHGVVPVPAPATATLLHGIPCYCGTIQGELCTPTGAALLAHLAEEFGPMPVMSLEKTGYGIGKKEFPAANCVRAFWGESGDPQQAEIVELCCHIDDMTAEALAFAGEQLLAQGALDISAAPLTMKKGRAGISFTVLCKPKDEDRIAHAILRETSTNGVRSRRCGKYILTPSLRTVNTIYGPIRIKCADGGGVHREKPEYDDVAAAARTAGLPFLRVWEDVLMTIKLEEHP